MCPVNSNSNGLFHSVSPYLSEKGTFNLFTNLFLAQGPRADTLYDRRWYGEGISGIGYTFSPQWELFLAGYTYGKYIERPFYYKERGDIKIVETPEILFGIKAGFPLPSRKYSSAFGFMLWFSQWIGQQTGSLPCQIEEEFAPTKPHGSDIGITGIMGFKLPIGNLYLNSGYIINSNYHDGSKRKSYAFFGTGVEFNLLPFMHPGIELSKKDTIISVTPQIKIFFKNIIEFNFGLDFPISEFDWVPDDILSKSPRFMLSLNLNFGFKKPPPMTGILVKGNIYDIVSKKPVYGSIFFAGPISGAIKNNKEVYNLPLAKAGAYRIRVDYPDYKWQEKVIRVMAYDTVTMDFALERKVNWSIAGKILNKETGEPVDAIVKLVGRNKAETSTDPSSGEYKFWIETGSYYLRVKATGYKSQKISIHISNLTTLKQDVLLKPKK